MLGVAITLIAVAVVAYFVVKNYYAPIVLLFVGFICLIIAGVMGVDPVSAKQSTHFFGFDIFKAFTNLTKGRLAGLGLNIMIIAGFSTYMERIGASKALVKVCVKPLSVIRSPYVLLALTYVVGQFMALFINSAVGLGLLLMASIYPLLVSLGTTRQAAAAVIATTCCLDLGPSSSNSLQAADIVGTDVVSYFVHGQIPVAICVVAAVAIGHYFVQRWFDNRDRASGRLEKVEKESAAASEVDVSKAFEGTAPLSYAILPILPLVILLVFSPLVYKAIKIDLVTAIVFCIVMAFLFDLAHKRDLKQCIASCKAVFEGMGKVLTSTVMLLCCAELFALGLKNIGGITTMIQGAASIQGLGIYIMLIVMMLLMVISSIVMGSGNAAWFAFSPLLPEAAKSVGYNTIAMAVPVQLSAGLARTMSPITGVIIAVSGVAGLSPLEIIRRTCPVMTLGIIVDLIAAMIFL